MTRYISKREQKKEGQSLRAERHVCASVFVVEVFSSNEEEENFLNSEKGSKLELDEIASVNFRSDKGSFSKLIVNYFALSCTLQIFKRQVRPRLTVVVCGRGS